MKIIFLVLATAISGCVSNSPYVPIVELGIGHEFPSRIIGEGGVTGIFRVQQPLVPDKVFLGYTHVSELGAPDRGTLDQVEFFVRFPLAVDK